MRGILLFALFSLTIFFAPQALAITECPANAQTEPVVIPQSLLDPQQCPAPATCFKKSPQLGGPYYNCHKFTKAYIDSSCNTSITLDQMIDCTSGTDRSFAIRCGTGATGFTCTNSVKERLCINGEKTEQNVVCQSDPIAKACKEGDPDCTTSKGQRCQTSNGALVPIGGDGIFTAIGCIPTEPGRMVEGFLRFSTLAGGGIALILMILAGLQMITAEGNAESIKVAQEKFYSAIIGLLLIIFSVLLMQVIGVDILGLKGFGA